MVASMTRQGGSESSSAEAVTSAYRRADYPIRAQVKSARLTVVRARECTPRGVLRADRLAGDYQGSAASVCVVPVVSQVGHGAGYQRFGFGPVHR